MRPSEPRNSLQKLPMSIRTVGFVLLAVAVAACAPKEEAVPETLAAAETTPAPLTPEAFAGTWNGQSVAEGTDSVVSRWAVVARPEGSGMFIAEGYPDSVAVTATFYADSSIMTSVPYNAPGAPAGAGQVMFRGVGRLTGENTMAGVTSIMLASKPDSILARTRWTATRQ